MLRAAHLHTWKTDLVVYLNNGIEHFEKGKGRRLFCFTLL